MKRVFNYNTGKLYESDGTYTITVTETPLSRDVYVDPDYNKVVDEKYFSYDEALDTAYKTLDDICAKEEMEIYDDDIVETENGLVVTIPGYKKWTFEISGVLDDTDDDMDYDLEESFSGRFSRRRSLKESKFYTVPDSHSRVIEEIDDRDLDTLNSYMSILGKYDNNINSAANAINSHLNYLHVKYMLYLRNECSYMLDDKRIESDKLRQVITETIKLIDKILKYNHISLDEFDTNESVSRRFSRLRSMFESARLNEEDDDNEENNNDDEENDDNDDEEKEMKAVVITVKKGDEDKCKEELIDAGIDEDDIEILEGDDDDENVDIRIDVNSIYELKDYLDKKGIDLEEEIGGEIVGDDDEDEEGSDEEGDGEDKGDEGGEDFDFDNLGDLFGAEGDEE